MPLPDLRNKKRNGKKCARIQFLAPAMKRYQITLAVSLAKRSCRDSRLGFLASAASAVFCRKLIGPNHAADLLSPPLRRVARSSQPDPTQQTGKPRIPAQRIRQRFAAQINQ